MSSARLERIKSLIERAGSTYVSVTFIKKDGSERQLTFNPADHNEIKGTGDVKMLLKVIKDNFETFSTCLQPGTNQLPVLFPCAVLSF